MGLIKTAIMTGGGVYAMKKVIEASERRHVQPQSQPQSQRQVDTDYAQQQEFFSPRGPPPGYQDQRSLKQYAERSDLVRGQNEPYYAADNAYDTQMRQNVYSDRSPPFNGGLLTEGWQSAYGQQRESGVIVPEQREMQRSTSSMDGLVKVAHDILGKGR